MPIDAALPNASIPDEREAIRGNNAVENAKSTKKIPYLVARRDIIGSFPGPQPSLYPVRNVAVLPPISCHSLLNCVENHALLPSYCGRKYIENYANTASGIPAYLGLFV